MMKHNFSKLHLSTSTGTSADTRDDSDSSTGIDSKPVKHIYKQIEEYQQRKELLEFRMMNDNTVLNTDLKPVLYKLLNKYDMMIRILKRCNKTLMVLLLALVITGTGFAQDCLYSRNEVDEFTKKTIRITIQYPLAVNTDLVLYGMLWNVDGTKGLRIIFEHSTNDAYKHFCLNDDSKLSFLMSDGNVISLSSIEDLECNTTDTSRPNKYTQTVTGNFLLTDDQILLLKKNTISKIRINFVDTYSDLVVNDTDSQQYFKLFSKCISEPAHVVQN